MKNIICFGGFYCTNIGNEFYDKGMMYILNNLCKEKFRIIHTSDLPQYFWASYSQKTLFDHVSFFFENKNVDYVVIGGPVLDILSLENWKKHIEYFLKNNIKVILLSAGGSTYNKEEVSYVKNFLKTNRLYALISRDSVAYELYNMYFEHSYDGICNAFLIPKYYKPYSFNAKPYYVLNFESIREPLIQIETGSVKISGKRRLKYYNTCIDGKYVIRTKHTCFMEHRKKYFEPNIYISDVYEDYLNIYANADGVFSDRVHACVATLAQGGRAMLFNDTARGALFERVGVNNIRNELCSADMNYIETECKKMENYVLGLFQ